MRTALKVLTSLRTLLWLLCLGTAPLPFAAGDDCNFGEVVIKRDFETARVNSCKQVGENHYFITTEPEHRPINPSPWYAFAVSAQTPRRIVIEMRYAEHKHRYPPKYSRDLKTWKPLDKKRFRVRENGTLVRFSLKADERPLYIAGQEIIDNAFYRDYIAGLKARGLVQTAVMGTSVQKRPIEKMISRGSSGLWVLIVGRQHPPEVTGALALLGFLDTVFADTPLARRFREKFNLLIVPNLNPDGVAMGNWRFNAGNVDMNRDWGPYEQPETQLVARELERMHSLAGSARAGRLVLGLDFHSTSKNVFYTQPDNSTTTLPLFTRDWLAALRERLSGTDYGVIREDTNNPGLPTFKTFLSERYGIPSITYELGDNTERKLINRSAGMAAQEMMRLLLEHDFADDAARM